LNNTTKDRSTIVHVLVNTFGRSLTPILELHHRFLDANTLKRMLKLYDSRRDINDEFIAAAKADRLDLANVLLDDTKPTQEVVDCVIVAASEVDHVSIIERMLDYKIKPSRNGLFWTGVYAVHYHQDVLFRRILDLGVTEHALNEYVCHGAERGNFFAVDAVLKHGRIGQHTIAHRALHHAAENGYTDIVKRLLDALSSPPDIVAILCRAASSGHADIVTILLERGRSVPISAYPDSIRRMMAQAAQGGRLDVVRSVLAHLPRDPESLNMTQWVVDYCIRIAAFHGLIDGVRVLLGADQKPTTHGLVQAAECAIKRDSAEMLNLVLSSCKEWTPNPIRNMLTYAVANDKLVMLRILLRAGVTPAHNPDLLRALKSTAKSILIRQQLNEISTDCPSI
jgi:hypothetical protein